tara:strand:- start:1798 stop:2148 length:351 start_codon:yes stop_codon:yes gene_type:complete
MGIIVNSEQTFNGFKVNNMYVSFGNQTIYLEKGYTFNPLIEGSIDSYYYQVSSTAQKWLTKEKENYLDRVPVTIKIKESELKNNLYELLYTELKKSFQSTTDVLEVEDDTTQDQEE